MLTLFDDEELWSHGHDLLSTFYQAVLARHLARFFIVDGQDINAFQRFNEIVPTVVHPEIHGIKHYQFWTLWQLVQYLLLNRRHEVTEHQILRVFICIRNNRVKICQHIELRINGVARVHICMILTAPEKRLAVLDNLNPVKIGPLRLQ